MNNNYFERDFVEMKAKAKILQQQYELNPNTEASVVYINGLAELLHGDLDPPSLENDQIAYFYEILHGLYNERPNNDEVITSYARGIHELSRRTWELEEEADVETPNCFDDKLFLLYKENPKNETIVELYVKNLVPLAYDSGIKRVEKILEEVENIYHKHPNNKVIASHYSDILFTLARECDIERQILLTEKLRVLHELPHKGWLTYRYVYMLVELIKAHSNITDKQEIFEKLYKLYADGFTRHDDIYAAMHVLMDSINKKEASKQLVARVFSLYQNDPISNDSIRFFWYHDQRNLEKRDIVIDILDELRKEQPSEYLGIFASALSEFCTNPNLYYGFDGFIASAPERLQKLYHENRDNPKILAWYVKGLERWINHYGHKEEGEKVEALIKELCAENPDNAEVISLYNFYLKRTM